MNRDFKTVPTFCGLRVVETITMTHTIEDWSRVRSPARARRRRKRGFSQNIIVRQVPRPDCVVMNGTIYIHPETMTRLRKHLHTSV